jgi:hypothetical protein
MMGAGFIRRGKTFLDLSSMARIGSALRWEDRPAAEPSERDKVTG